MGAQSEGTNVGGHEVDAQLESKRFRLKNVRRLLGLDVNSVLDTICRDDHLVVRLGPRCRDISARCEPQNALSYAIPSVTPRPQSDGDSPSRLYSGSARLCLARADLPFQ